MLACWLLTALADRTRFFMSIFMFAVLALNPLGFLLNNQAAPGLGGGAAGDGAYADAHGGARSLLFKFTDDAPGTRNCCAVLCN